MTLAQFRTAAPCLNLAVLSRAMNRNSRYLYHVKTGHIKWTPRLEAEVVKAMKDYALRVPNAPADGSKH